MAGYKSRTKAFDGFPDGVNNVFREESVPESALREAVNVDLLPDGKVRRRSGYLRRLALSDFGRSGASHLGYLFVADGRNFYRVDTGTLYFDSKTGEDHFDFEMIANVAKEAFLSYAAVNEYLYVTDGHGTSFRVDASGNVTQWAPEQPPGVPSLAPLNIGGLPAGRYQVAMTYLRGREESGAYTAGVVDVPEGGSIQVNDIARPDNTVETTHVRLYVTNTDGEILYSAKEIPLWPAVDDNQATGVVISSLPSGKALETQFLEPLPAGHIVRKFNGRLYSAVENTLFYSQAMRYGLCNLSQDYIEFDARIDMVRPVEGGIFVSAGKRVHFFAGEDPEVFVRSLAHPYGSVEGTDEEVRAGMFSFENLKTGTVAVWWSKNGTMVVGLPNGQVVPLRDGELSLPEYSRGATMVREENGVQQLVSVLQDPKTPTSPLAAQDEATVTVHRNGIEV